MKDLKNKIMSIVTRAKTALTNNRAEVFIDSGVKILIAVVIGVLLLSGLYVLFGDTILPTLTEKISNLFDYAG